MTLRTEESRPTPATVFSCCGTHRLSASPLPQGAPGAGVYPFLSRHSPCQVAPKPTPRKVALTARSMTPPASNPRIFFSPARIPPARRRRKCPLTLPPKKSGDKWGDKIGGTRGQFGLDRVGEKKNDGLDGSGGGWGEHRAITLSGSSGGNRCSPGYI